MSDGATLCNCKSMETSRHHPIQYITSISSGREGGRGPVEASAGWRARWLQEGVGVGVGVGVAQICAQYTGLPRLRKPRAP